MMTEAITWNAPVLLRANQASLEIYKICDTREAGHFLLSVWQAERDQKYERAIRVCGLVLNGTLDPEVARDSFWVAARGSWLLHDHFDLDASLEANSPWFLINQFQASGKDRL